MSACSASRCSSAGERDELRACSSTRSRRACTIPATGRIDACLVSQFENHMRAIAGWPLGDTARHSDAVMTNLIGADVEQLARARRRARHRRASLRQGGGAARPQDGPHHPAFAEEFVTTARHLDKPSGPFCYEHVRRDCGTSGLRFGQAYNLASRLPLPNPQQLKRR